MVDVIGRAKVIITGDVDPRSIDQAGGKIGSRLKVGAAVGVAALGTLAVAGVKAFKSFEEAEAQSRKLNQVLDNMGEAKATPAVEKLADELMRLTGVDDEVIKGGQTILATFSDVAESAGEVGGTFERATKAALDMSATGFGSVESASVMLGKALQDPVKGVTALGRAGVTFTAEQKELIKSLVETGEAGKAQALILKEVEKQVGGTAEASATESAKISAAMGEIQEAAGGAISTLLGGEEGEGLSDVLFDVSDSLNNLAESEGWGDLGKALRDLNKDVDDNTTFLGKLNQRNKESVKSIGDLAAGVKRYAKEVSGNLKTTWEVWGEWAENVGDAINRVIDKFKDLEDASYSASQSDGLDLLTDPGGDNAITRSVGGPASGLTLINENGPELVSLPAGSYVHNAPATQEILEEIRSASGGGNTQNYYITGPVSLAELRQRAAWYDTYGTRFG